MLGLADASVKILKFSSAIAFILLDFDIAKRKLVPLQKIMNFLQSFKLSIVIDFGNDLQLQVISQIAALIIQFFVLCLYPSFLVKKFNTILPSA